MRFPSMHDEQGSALAEAAIALPLVLAIIAGTMQLAFAYLVSAHLELAAGRAARAAAVWVPRKAGDEEKNEFQLDDRGASGWMDSEVSKGEQVFKAAALTILPVATRMTDAVVLQAMAAGQEAPQTPDLAFFLDRLFWVTNNLELQLGRYSDGSIEWLECEDEPCTIEPGEDIVVGLTYSMPLFFPAVNRWLSDQDSFWPRLTLRATASLPAEDIGLPIEGAPLCEW